MSYFIKMRWQLIFLAYVGVQMVALSSLPLYMILLIFLNAYCSANIDLDFILDIRGLLLSVECNAEKLKTIHLLGLLHI